MHAATCTSPRRLARTILGAWRAGSASELERRLRRGERCARRAADSLAAEQAELLAAVAADMRRALAGGSHQGNPVPESLEVHLRLLRHLAG
jgi:hypothetical protein